jgi:hypothetical protein
MYIYTSTGDETTIKTANSDEIIEHTNEISHEVVAKVEV